MKPHRHIRLQHDQGDAVPRHPDPRHTGRGHAMQHHLLPRRVRQPVGIGPDLRPVAMRHLVIMPGDRAAVVMGARDEKAHAKALSRNATLRARYSATLQRRKLP